MRRAALAESGCADIKGQHVGISRDFETVISFRGKPGAGRKDHDTLPNGVGDMCCRKAVASLVPDADGLAISDSPRDRVGRIEPGLFAAVALHGRG